MACRWLLRAVAGDPADIQIMYGLSGERWLDERELGWLAGYERSTPVRIGNAAASQLQLDVYGEVLDALYQTRVHSGARETMRGRSRVRCLGGWRRGGSTIHRQILDRSWNARRGAFTQSYDSDVLDASVLVMPSVGFVEATDPRFAATVDAICRELSVDGLLLRYPPHRDGSVDGVAGAEHPFLQRVLDLRNDVGLPAEEYDPHAGGQLGNFPQALTHLALVNTALVLGGAKGVREPVPDQSVR